MKKEENALDISMVTEETFSEFLILIGKLAEFEKLEPPDDAAKERLRTDCLGDKPKYEAYICKVDGKPAAYTIHFFTYSSFLALPTLYIEDVFVLEEYRRRGIGAQMFGNLRKIAKREGCDRIEFTVLKWNTPAQKFYCKNKAKRLEWYLYRMVKKDF